MTDQRRGVFARPSELNPVCQKCDGRDGHFVNCPDLGLPTGAREPKVCDACHIAHAGDCW